MSSDFCLLLNVRWSRQRIREEMIGSKVAVDITDNACIKLISIMIVLFRVVLSEIPSVHRVDGLCLGLFRGYYWGISLIRTVSTSTSMTQLRASCKIWLNVVLIWCLIDVVLRCHWCEWTIKSSEINVIAETFEWICRIDLTHNWVVGYIIEIDHELEQWIDYGFIEWI